MMENDRTTWAKKHATFDGMMHALLRIMDLASEMGSDDANQIRVEAMIGLGALHGIKIYDSQED